MKRIEYLDRAKAIGMFLVYYGHFVEKLAREAGIASAALQWRVIYAFHMPLFFFLAGVFWKPAPFSRELFFEKLKTRLVPSIFFSLLVLPLWAVLTPEKLWDFITAGEYLSGKSLDSVLWFLSCLMMVEFLAALIVRYLKADKLRLAVYAFASCFFGYYILIGRADSVLAMTGIKPKTWFLDDAFIALLFYIFGHLSRELLFKFNEAKGWLLGLAIAPISAFLFRLAFTSNPDRNLVVVMNMSLYRNVWYFIATAFLGILFVLAASRVFAVNISLANFIGQNTLVFLGLNGIGFIFLDAWVVSHTPWLPTRQVEVFLFSSLYVAAVMIFFSAPLAWLIRRWFPELIAAAWTPTSLPPPMSEWGNLRFFSSTRAWLQKYLLRSDV